MKKEKRFVILDAESEVFGMSRTTLVDTQTGVMYLFVQSGTGGGLTPLLDAQGRPLLCRRSEWESKQ